MKAPRRALGIHSSGRFDRPVESLRRSVTRLRKVRCGRRPFRRRVAWITGTETNGRNAREMDRVLGTDPRWDHAHIAGRESGECWATWDTRYLELAGTPYAHQLTDETWQRVPEYGGKPAPLVTALVVPLRVVGRPGRRTIYLVVIHMPTDSTDRRAAVWLDCAAGIRELEDDIRAKDPYAELVIEADWNKDHRNPKERAAIEHHVARPLGLVQGWEGSRPERGGTHGRALIDGVVASARLLGWSTPWCWLTRDDDSSDHRPYVHAVRWPLLPKRVRKSIRSKGARA